jgi:hypothetical protein
MNDIKKTSSPDIKLGGRMSYRGIMIIPASTVIDGNTVTGMEINIYFTEHVQFILDRHYAEKLAETILMTLKELDKAEGH